jgi:hypothetical protein
VGKSAFAGSGHHMQKTFYPQINADEHRYFFAFACGEATNKTFLSVFICGQYSFRCLISSVGQSLPDKRWFNQQVNGGQCSPYRDTQIYFHRKNKSQNLSSKMRRLYDVFPAAIIE